SSPTRPSARSATVTRKSMARARARTTEMVWVELGVEDDGGPLLHGPAHEQDRLGDGGGLIEEGGVGDVETGEVLDDLLEVQQRLEPTLGDLGLVRGVGGVPGGVLDEVAADDGRGDRVKVAL